MTPQHWLAAAETNTDDISYPPIIFTGDIVRFLDFQGIRLEALPTGTGVLFRVPKEVH